MKVLHIGYAKTGTKTMSLAFRILGYKNYDFDTTSFYLGNEWIKILNHGGTKEDFYRMYKDVDSSTDGPAYLFWPEILEAFPDTKLIFTMRDEDEWTRSILHQIYTLRQSYALQVLAWFSPAARKFYRLLKDGCRIALGIPDSRLFFQLGGDISPTVVRKLYREHNSYVLTHAPKKQMLVYNVKEGWEPLCKFLEKPVPDAPFPHKNQRGTVIDEYMQESPIFRVMKKEFFMYLSLYIVVIAGLLLVFLNGLLLALTT